MTPIPGRRRIDLVAAGGALALLLTATGCQAVDRSGGEASRPQTTLTFAQPNGGVPDQLAAWAAEVEKRSNGALHVDFRGEWRSGTTDYETGTLHDVAAGTVDMAWVGARAFDRAGSTAFQPLLAPMLVDSHEVQAAVFDDGIPQQMGQQVTGVGVHVVGVLPGPMRKVLGLQKAFRRPADFAGTVVGMQDSALTEESLHALGATPRPLPSGADLSGTDAYEQQLSSVSGNHYTDVAHHYTGNLDLWPRPLVVVAGQSVWDRLGPADRTALDEATAAAVPGALTASRTEDHADVADLCGDGLTMDTATADDLAALRAAVQPVYDRLGSDPATAQWLHRIEQVKARVAAAPDAVSCGDGGAPPAATAIDGTYLLHVDWTKTQPAGCPLDGGEGEQVVDFRMELKDGRALIYETDAAHPTPTIGETDHYTVFRDRLQMRGGMTTRFELSGDTLTFSDMRSDCEDVTVWTTLPWHRVSG